MWIFLNDNFVDRKEAVVSVFDHGYLYGDGIYETLRAYAGRIFMLQQHLAGLRRSGRLIGLDLPIPEKDWPALLSAAISRNGLTDAYLRITISRGEGEIGLDPALCPRPTAVILAKPFAPYPSHLFQDGVSLAILQVRRNLPPSLSPQIKSLNFLNNILAKQEATRARAFDGIMLNAEGHLTECTISNLFFVRGGRLGKPSGGWGLLDGVTREQGPLLAPRHGRPIAEGPFKAEALAKAQGR